MTVAHAGAIHHARAMLAELGIPCDDESTADTPARLVMALRDLTWGMRDDPARHLARTFPFESHDAGMIAVPGIEFVSVCEHHILPFTGTATVAYIPTPGARIVGLSKLPRLVLGYAARPQMQEHLGRQIVDTITYRLDTVGAAVSIRSVHTCMTLR
jgi:GTP cyclohydrolase I